VFEFIVVDVNIYSENVAATKEYVVPKNIETYLFRIRVFVSMRYFKASHYYQECRKRFLFIDFGFRSSGGTYL